VAAAIGVIIWFLPVPDGLNEEAWRLFAIFLTTILTVLIQAVPIFLASVLGMVVAMLTGVLRPDQAYAGFSKDFILLIVAAFLVARAVIKSGLGRRIAFHVIRRLGRSTLGLGYSVMITDAIIGPAFPSNTARSGVLFPIVQALCLGSGSSPDDGTEAKLGNYLMIIGMASLTVSSALWLTAMATNPLGATIAAESGVEIGFASWVLAAAVPALSALVLLPLLLLKVVNPETKHTPEAPAAAVAELEKMGPMSARERLTAGIFIFMVTGWALSEFLAIDKAGIAFVGLAILIMGRVYTMADLKTEGEALSIWIWFGILFTLSTTLNEFGFMGWLGDKVAVQLQGMTPPVVFVCLIVTYVLLHYLFVSQTAHLLALFSVFMSVGITSGVDPALMALMLLFATNFFAAITPQGSSANVLFVSSGYLTTGELYTYGAVITLANLLIYLIIGTPWILLVS
jgi:DASS family divalent anion:Na+ symporter